MKERVTLLAESLRLAGGGTLRESSEQRRKKPKERKEDVGDCEESNYASLTATSVGNGDGSKVGSDDDRNWRSRVVGGLQKTGLPRNSLLHSPHLKGHQDAKPPFLSFLI